MESSAQIEEREKKEDEEEDKVADDEQPEPTIKKHDKLEEGKEQEVELI